MYVSLLCQYLYRTFAKPPEQVQTVCECVLIMKGYKEINWKTVKGMMADTNFLNTLKNMDVDGITDSQVGLGKGGVAGETNR